MMGGGGGGGGGGVTLVHKVPSFSLLPPSYASLALPGLPW